MRTISRIFPLVDDNEFTIGVMFDNGLVEYWRSDYLIYILNKKIKRKKR